MTFRHLKSLTNPCKNFCSYAITPNIKNTNMCIHCERQNSSGKDSGMKCSAKHIKKNNKRFVLVLNNGTMTNIHHNAQMNQRK